MTTMIPESRCYTWDTARDTVWLKVEKFPNVVIGVLKYQFAEKDNNAGTFEGKIYGDKLIADYSFSSEGRQSVRQVAFRLEGDKAVEGYGDMEERDGKLVFRDTANIDFSSGMEMRSVSCVDNDEKFRIAATVAESIPDGSQHFFSHKWFLKEMNGKEIAAANSTPFLTFSPGQVSTVAGSTGCNNITGSFALTGEEQISFAPLATTRKHCPDVPDEATFLGLLQTSDRWRFENSQLILSKGGEDRLTFRADR